MKTAMLLLLPLGRFFAHTFVSISLIIALGLSILYVGAVTTVAYAIPSMPYAYGELRAGTNFYSPTQLVATGDTGPVSLDIPPIVYSSNGITQIVSGWATTSFHQYASAGYGDVRAHSEVEGFGMGVGVYALARYSIAVIQNAIPPFMPSGVPIIINASGYIEAGAIPTSDSAWSGHVYDRVYVKVGNTFIIDGHAPDIGYLVGSILQSYDASYQTALPVSTFGDLYPTTIEMVASTNIDVVTPADVSATIRADPSISFDQELFNAEYGSAAYPLAEYFGLLTSPYLTTAVPEPSTMLLLGSGLIGLAGYGRKKLFKK